METELPPGYRVTPGAVEHLAELQRVFSAASVAASGSPGPTLDDYSTWLTSEHVDLPRDARLAWAPDGALAGAEVVDCRSPHVRPRAVGAVAPDHEGRGLGTALLGWALVRAREEIELAPPDETVILTATCTAGHEPALALFRAAGFDLRRYFHELEVEFDGAPEPPGSVEGVRIRPFVPGEDDRATWRTVHTAFRDHYGHVERDEEEGLAGFRQQRAHPRFDPELWLVAEAADGELAGAILCLDNTDGDETRGSVDTLGVLPAFRGRGLGRALLLAAFSAFFARGMRGATLWVDSENPTGATRLYSSVGMSVTNANAFWELDLR